MNSQPPSSPQPLVTVVVPAHNEEAFIQECLSAVRETGWPAEALELLVIDHSSTDGTCDRARAAGASVLPQSGGKIGAVRNCGLRAAKGEFIAFVDADCTVAPTWLRCSITILQSNCRIGAVGGPCLSPQAGTWVERTFAPSEPPAIGIRQVKTLATSSLIARTSVLRNAGEFNEELASGEDDDMSLRLRNCGYILISSPDCYVVHYGYARSWSQVVRKERWHGSNQLESRSGFDPTLLLTHLFAAFSVAVAISALATLLAPSAMSLTALAVSLAVQAVPPVGYALKRLHAARGSRGLAFAWLAVGYAYFLGRSIGLVGNYWRLRRASGP